MPKSDFNKRLGAHAIKRFKVILIKGIQNGALSQPFDNNNGKYIFSYPVLKQPASYYCILL